MSIDLTQFFQVFFEEAAEHLSTMETLLLALDVNNPSMDDLNAIFRSAHSIKGVAINPTGALRLYSVCQNHGVNIKI